MRDRRIRGAERAMRADPNVGRAISLLEQAPIAFKQRP